MEDAVLEKIRHLEEKMDAEALKAEGSSGEVQKIQNLQSVLELVQGYDRYITEERWDKQFDVPMH